VDDKVVGLNHEIWREEVDGKIYSGGAGGLNRCVDTKAVQNFGAAQAQAFKAEDCDSAGRCGEANTPWIIERGFLEEPVASRVLSQIFLRIEGGRSVDTLMLRAPQTAGMR